MEPSKIEFQRVLDFLGSIPIIQQLPGTSVKKIAEVVRFRQFGANEHIVREGEAGEGLYFIWKGEAEVPLSKDADVSCIRQPLTAGDYFGYASPGPVKETHKTDVIASTEVTCLVLSHEYGDLLSPVSIWSSEKGKDIPSVEVEQILQLEGLEVDLFRGITLSGSPSRGHWFGGQLIAQAVAAASKSVDPSLLVHSLHAYFLRIGHSNSPVLFRVQRTRDGNNFATRNVSALQRGRVICSMSASFQREEKGFEHQKPMPVAPDPEKINTREVESYFMDPRVPMAHKKEILGSKVGQAPIDIRLCDPEDRVKPENMEPRQRMWIRARGRLSDDQALQRCVAAYASDMAFLETSLRPHRGEVGYSASFLSLDHSIWFHKSFRADDWLLYVVESPCASNARALVLGHMYTRNGELVVTVAQEGVIRKFDMTEAKGKSKL